MCIREVGVFFGVVVELHGSAIMFSVSKERMSTSIAEQIVLNSKIDIRSMQLIDTHYGRKDRCFVHDDLGDPEHNPKLLAPIEIWTQE